jgi:general secretion pathway protein A
MYTSFFGFDRSPFAITPDPTFLFLSKQHKEALAHLLYGMSGEGGFVQITGEVGTGKTTLCRYMVEQAPEDVDVALILNPRQTAVELVVSICEELRIELPQDTSSLKALIDILNRHLLSNYSKGRSTVLIIDEAQNLSPDTLEQVRLLTNLETNTRKLMQIHLLGQPELKKLLSRPDLRQLAQRITARYHLGPLSSKETEEYVRYRLNKAGREKPIFTRGALRLVHKFSRGIPRIINIICERALLGAYGRRSKRVNRALVRKAFSEVMGKPHVFGFPRLSYWTIAGLLFIALGSAWIVSPWYDSDGLSAIIDRTVMRHFWADSPPGLKKSRMDPPGVKSAEASKPDQTPDTSLAPISRSRPDDVPVIMKENRGDEGVKFSRLLQDGMLETDEETAFTALFGLWHMKYSELRGETACRRAVTAKLSCFSSRGNWGKLRQLNLPAVLRLVQRGRSHYVALVGLSKTGAILGFPDRTIKVPYAEIDPYWLGDFVLLWKPPNISVDLLRKGMIGPDVLWLKGHLGRVEGSDKDFENKAVNNVFDEDLERRVMNFQSSQGIAMDGKVGQETLVHLTGLAKAPSVPDLWQDDPEQQEKKHVHNP